MSRRFLVVHFATAASVLAMATAAGQASSLSPAALLTFPYLVLDQEDGVDTVVQITNTADQPVEVRCLLETTTAECVDGSGSCLSGNVCSGSCIPHHAATTFRLRLTRQQPIGWALSKGMGAPIAGGEAPVGDDNTDAGTRIPAVTDSPFQGVLRCTVVDDHGMPADRNVLIGTASIQTVLASGGVDVTPYNAIGIAARPGASNGDELLVLGGTDPEYASCPASLVLPSVFDGATIPVAGQSRTVDTTLILVPCGGDFFSDPVRSVLQFFVYNEFDQRFSTSRPIDAQLVTLLSNLDTTQSNRSIMHVGVTGTLTGQTYMQEVGGGGALGMVIENHRIDDAHPVLHSALDLFSERARPRAAVVSMLQPACQGDCNGDGRVTIDELVLQVKIALGAAPLPACGIADRDRGGSVRIEELTSSVRVALSSCPVRQVPTPIIAPTATPVPKTPLTADGPAITYLGIASPDDAVQQPTGHDDDGRPIYTWPVGQGLSLIIEARPGLNQARVGNAARAPSDDTLPDLQVIVSRPLGDGSALVCDADRPNLGGVPATAPFDFDTEGAVAAINDLGCRADDGSGAPGGRPGPRSCLRDPQTGFLVTASPSSQTQFCIPIAKAWAFPVGDTLVAARLRDIQGFTGPVGEMVVRIEPVP